MTITRPEPDPPILAQTCFNVKTDLLNDPLVVPGRHHVLHVEVGGEKADDAVGNDGDGFCQQGAVVSENQN